MKTVGKDKETRALAVLLYMMYCSTSVHQVLDVLVLRPCDHAPADVHQEYIKSTSKYIKNYIK